MGDAKTFVESPAGDSVSEHDTASNEAEISHRTEHDTASHEALAAVNDSLHALDEKEPVVEAVKKPAWRSRVITGIRIIAALAIIFYLLNTTIKQWADVKQTFHSLSWTSLVLAQLAALLGVGATMMGWRSALTDLDHKLPVITAAPIMLVGQLGKYLPGSVWAYVVQMDLGRRAGVPRTKAIIASLVSTGVGVTAGLLLGTLGLPAAFTAADHDPHGAVGRLAFYVALALLPIAVICAHPKVLTRLIQLLLRVLRRPPLDRSLTWRGVLWPMFWSAFAFICFGTHLWILAGNAAPGPSGWLRCIGLIALAICVSIFVLIAPSGIGVREFLITVALGGGGVALGIALASRLLFTIADVLGAGLAAALGAHRLTERP